MAKKKYLVTPNVKPIEQKNTNGPAYYTDENGYRVSTKYDTSSPAFISDANGQRSSFSDYYQYRINLMKEEEERRQQRRKEKAEAEWKKWVEENKRPLTIMGDRAFDRGKQFRQPGVMQSIQAVQPNNPLTGRNVDYEVNGRKYTHHVPGMIDQINAAEQYYQDNIRGREQEWQKEQAQTMPTSASRNGMMLDTPLKTQKPEEQQPISFLQASLEQNRKKNEADHNARVQATAQAQAFKLNPNMYDDMIMQALQDAKKKGGVQEVESTFNWILNSLFGPKQNEDGTYEEWTPDAVQQWKDKKDQFIEAGIFDDSDDWRKHSRDQLKKDIENTKTLLGMAQEIYDERERNDPANSEETRQLIDEWKKSEDRNWIYNPAYANRAGRFRQALFDAVNGAGAWNAADRESAEEATDEYVRIMSLYDTDTAIKMIRALNGTYETYDQYEAKLKDQLRQMEILLDKREEYDSIFSFSPSFSRGNSEKTDAEIEEELAVWRDKLNNASETYKAEEENKKALEQFVYKYNADLMKADSWGNVRNEETAKALYDAVYGAGAWDLADREAALDETDMLFGILDQHIGNPTEALRKLQAVNGTAALINNGDADQSQQSDFGYTGYAKSIQQHIDELEAELKERSKYDILSGAKIGNTEYVPENDRYLWAGDLRAQTTDGYDIHSIYHNLQYPEQDPQWYNQTVYAFMDDRMKDYFKSLYNDGLYAEAEAFLEAARPYMQTAKNDYEAQEMRQWAASEHGATFSAYNTLTKPLKNLIGLVTTIGANFNDYMADPDNPVWGDVKARQAGTQVREERWGEGILSVANKIFGDKIDLLGTEINTEDAAKNIGKFLYDTTMSIADNVMAFAVGGGVTAASGLTGDAAQKLATNVIQFVMSSGATTDAMLAGLESNKSPLQACIDALASGAIEAYTEKAGIDNLFKMTKGGGKGWLAKMLLKQGAIEGLEEGYSDVLNLLEDEVSSFLFNNESEIRQTYNSILATNGGDEKAAIRDTILGQLGKTGESMLSGFLSGFLMSAGNAATNTTGRITNREIGNIVSNNDQAQNLIELGLASKDGRVQLNAKKMSEKIREGKKLSFRELGKLYKSISETESERTTAAVTESVQNTVKERLREIYDGREGISTGDISDMAEAVAVAVINPDQLTRRQQTLLKEHVAASQLVKDMSAEAGMDVSNPNYQIVQEAFKAAEKAGAEGRKNSVRLQDILYRQNSPEAAAQSAVQTAKTADAETVQLARQATGERTATMRDVVIDGRIGEVAGFKDGNFVVNVKAEDGSTVKRNVSYSELEAVDPTMAAVANYIETYQTGLSDSYKSRLINGIGAYKGDAISYLTETRNATIAGWIASDIGKTIDHISGTGNQELINSFYNEAKNDYEADEREWLKQAQGYKFKANNTIRINGVSRDDAEAWDTAIGELAQDQRDQISIINALADGVGMNVEYVSRDDLPNMYGSYNNGTMTINMKGQDRTSKGQILHSMLAAAGHEMTHHFKFTAPKAYKAMRQYMLNYLHDGGTDVVDMVRRLWDNNNAFIGKNNDERSNAYTLSDAVDEVMANGADQVMTNAKFINKLKQDNPSLFGKMQNFVQDFLKKIGGGMRGMNARSASYTARQFREVQDEIAEKWHIALQETIQNRQAQFSGNAEDAAPGTVAEAVVEATDKETGYVNDRMAEAASEAVDENGDQLFSVASMEHDKQKYRQMLVNKGLMTQAEIDNLFDIIDSAISVINEDGNRDILDLNEDYGPEGRAFNPVKPNSDSLYKVSLDFSTLCRKRLLQQILQEKIEKKYNTVMTKAERVALRNALKELQAEGKRIEIACALCYVESARLKSPAQIIKFLNDKRGKIIDYLSKNDAEYKGKIQEAVDEMTKKLGYPVGTPMSQMSRKDKKAIQDMKRKMYEEYKPTLNESREIEAAMTMDESYFKTASGLAQLKKDHPMVFDAYTTFVRNATKSKGLEGDVPFYAGDTETISDSLIQAMNAENGLRSQSWSDFQVYHMLDYIGAIIELSTRKAKMQAYTKVADYAKLMGRTGQMINLSLIPTDYDGKTLGYDPKEGMDYTTMQELRDEFPDTVGNICIGISDDHIRALLASDDIDYVIPYHKSSMDKATRAKIGLKNWREYEAYQNETNRDYNTTDRYAEDYHRHTKFSDWYNLDEARKSYEKHLNELTKNGKVKATVALKWQASNLAMRDMADNYIELCHRRGLQEKFSQFSDQDGYWKLLIDRKMINQKTGELIEQKAVQPVFNKDDILEILHNEVKRVREIQPDMDYVVDNVLNRYGEIRKAAGTKAVQQEVKAYDESIVLRNIVESAKDIDAAPMRGTAAAASSAPMTLGNVQGEEVAYAPKKQQARYADEDTRMSISDREYMDAVNSGDMDAAQRMVDQAAMNYGVLGDYKTNTPTPFYHGTPNGGFTVFGGTKTRNGADAAGSYWFTENDEEHAKVYRSYPGHAKPAENPMTYRVYLKVGNYADIGNGRVEALDYQKDGYGAPTKELKNVARQIAYKTMYEYQRKIGKWLTDDLAKVERQRANKITNQLTQIARDISADFIWQVTETKAFADLCKNEGLDGVIAWEEDKGYNFTEPRMVKTYGVFDKSSIKSADPVTYDDSGNVIPLSERFNEENDDIRYSFASLDDQITQLKDPADKLIDSIIVGGTPESLLNIGFNKLPITMDRRHAKEIVLGTRDVDHFLGENFIRQLPELLSNPVAIIESTSRPTDSIVIITNYKNPNTNQTALVPISISATGRHMNLNIDANNITSSYSKSVPASINDKTAESMLVDAVKKELVSPGSVYYLDTKISSQVLQSAGVQFSGKMQLGSSIHNIHDPNTNVNVKKINQTDTRQFGRWFGASKIRNKDNTAMVVYHGTPNDFTVFDKNAKHLHDAGDYGEGFYFTPDATEAQYMYGNGKKPMAVYLSMKSPFTLEYGQDCRNIKKLFSKNGIDYSKVKTEENGKLVSAQSFIRQFGQSEFTKALSSLGYDGVIVALDRSNYQENAEYIVFEPTQIKSATDNIGLFDPDEKDIRYSLPDVAPVNPTSDEWGRDAYETFGELKAAFPNLYNIKDDRTDEQKKNDTSVAITLSTYRKIFQKLKEEGFDGKILDASSGLGLGTKAGREEFGFDVDDIEPFPDPGYHPSKGTDYSALHDKYDLIISNAVLNVLTQDQRDALVKKMGELLNVGGKMIINVRSTGDVANLRKNIDTEWVKRNGEPSADNPYTGKKNIQIDTNEYYTGRGTYQKGFTNEELQAYLKDCLGNGYSYQIDNRHTVSGSSASSVIVTKNKSDTAVFSIAGGYVDYNRNAYLNESTVDKWLKDYAATSPKNYAQAYIAFFPTSEFVDMSTEDIYQRILRRAETEPLDEEKLRNATVYQPIQLRINEDGQIEGHEGRHRMTALDRAGIRRVPVLLFDNSTKYSKVRKDTFTLKGFGDTNSKTITLKDVIPFSTENREEIIEKFATPSRLEELDEKLLDYRTMRFSISDPDPVQEFMMNLDEKQGKTPTEARVIREYHAAVHALSEAQAHADEIRQQLKPRKGFNSFGDEARKLRVNLQTANGRVDRLQNELNKITSRKSFVGIVERSEELISQISGKTQEEIDQIIQDLKSKVSKEKSADRIRELEQQIRDLESEATKRVIAEQQKWRQVIARDKAAREQRTENARKRAQIGRMVNKLNDLIYKESDKKNIPEEMKPLAKTLVKIFLANDEGNRTKLAFDDKKKIKALKKFYDALDARDKSVMKFDDPDVEDAVNEALNNIRNGIKGLYAEKKGTERLQAVSEALDKIRENTNALYRMIQAQRTVWIRHKAIDLGRAAYMVVEGAEQRNPKGDLTGTLGKGLNSIGRFAFWGNMTPVYFFKNLHNEGMDLLNDAVKDGENRNGLLIQEFRDKIAAIADECGYATWDLDEKHSIKLDNGETVSLTTEQIMSLVATATREATFGPESSSHLENGGFVYEENANKMLLGRKVQEQIAHRVTKNDIDAITELLTREQQAYMHKMVALMSKDAARYGNEASQQMYGIKKFNEEYYFPFAVWDGVKNKASDAGAQTGMPDINRIAHQGFTKRRVNNAQNAILLRNFTDTVVEHLNAMINYSTMAQAIETMNRVLGYKIGENAEAEDRATVRNVESIFRERYGANAANYLRKYLKDLNGGAARNQTKSPQERLLTLFRKNAVAGSLSVALQQPLSYIRAANEISTKYLAEALNPKYYRGSMEEMLKHSGVAVIKNMGRFDMNYGRSGVEYMMPEAKKSKARAAYDAVETASTFLPELMDKVTWTRMWTACKLEQMELNPELTGEDLMSATAARFNELMRNTQVYDSVVVRSQNMREQGLGFKTLTSFMAEPTLTANLLADAWANRKGKGGKKALISAVMLFLLSAAAQAGIKGVIGAGRTPDEKKTLAENMAYKFAYNFIGEVNPLSLIPGYDDIVTTLSGGDIKDDSFSAITKLVDAAVKMVNPETYNKSGTELYRGFEDGIGQVAQIFTGVPLKNLMRDGRAMYNYFLGSYADRGEKARASSWPVVKYQTIDTIMQQDLIGAINKRLKESGGGYGTSNTDYYKRIYEARKTGNGNAADEMSEYLTLGKGVTEEALLSGVSSAAKKDSDTSSAEKADFLYGQGLTDETDFITKEFKAGSLTEKEASDLYKKYFPDMSDNDIYWKIDSLKYQMAHDNSSKGYSKYQPIMDAVETNKADKITAAVNDAVKHGLKTDTIASEITKEFKPIYLAASASEKVKLKDALTKAYKACGLTADQAIKKINGWKAK